ncbi:TetR family transcriptional regulator [Marmoricola endophyticus]|uniref:TetR family transcriptional regulator n=1 Tax=Marmoricola endophyticus TaxID=2040280 RepID=A0A917F6W2_9ACTN|nr:TetR/AcrR family transcriptional regulator [Marmoricola endophyticus]GGF49644.1 TetR family transcriptional regulator [Marmoricola endophyticus]
MTDSPRASRTRRDLVRSAVEVWGRDSRATLADVATAAGTGRATLHRYFPGRAELVAAVEEEALIRLGAAVDRAEVLEGSGAEALARLCHEMLVEDEVLGLVFADDALLDLETWEAVGHRDPVSLVVERGLDDGSLAADLPAQWLVVHVWAALFGGWLAARDGAVHARRAAELMVRTLLGGVAATS